jgi:hypothetical protein
MMPVREDHRMNVHQSTALISETRSATALRAALQNPELRQAAVINAALPEDLWFAAYPGKPKPPLALAKDLVDRPLSDRQFDYVLTCDGRSSVLAQVITSDPPNPERLNALLDAKGFNAAIAEQVFTTTAVSQQWLVAAAAKVGGNARLEAWLRYPQLYTDAEIITDLRVYSSWAPRSDKGRLAPLFAGRPATLEGGVYSDSRWARTPAAGCRHLHRLDWQRAVVELDAPEAADPDAVNHLWADERCYIWAAFVNNPVADLATVTAVNPLMRRLSEYDFQNQAANRLARMPFTVTGDFEAETDPVKIATLIRRTMPNDNRMAGREHDLPALLANPHLSSGDISRILVALKRSDCSWGKPAREAVSAFLERHPGEAADWGMTPGDWVLSPADAVDQPAADLWRMHPTDSRAGLTPEAVAAAGNYRGAGMWPYLAAAVAFLEDTVEDTVEAWMFILAALNTGAFAGTLADLALVANTTTR